MAQSAQSVDGKKKRPLLRGLVVLVVVLIALVAAAPTILSFGPAAGIARNAIAGAVQGDVQLRSVSLGWLSNQSIEGLAIRDSSGANAIDVNLAVRGGLLSLILSGGSTIDAAVSGSIKGTLEPDGSIGLSKLFAPPKSGAPSTPSSGGGSSSGIPANLRAALSVERLSIALTDVARNRAYSIDGLHGDARLDGSTGKLAAQFNGDTNFLGGKGSIGLKADVSNLQGVVDAAKLACDVALDAKNIRVPVDEKTAEFSAITLTVKSPGLGQSLAVGAKAEGVLDGATTSSLIADIAIEKPIGAGGAVAIGPANLKGSVSASKLPTSLAQPAVAAAGLVLSEDLGSTIDRLEIRAPGGGTEPITIELDAPKAKLKATAVVDASGGVKNGSASGTLEASPATLGRLAKVDVTGPARLALSARDLAWAPPPAGATPLANFVGQIELQPAAPVAWRDAQRKIAVALGSGGRIALGRAKTDDPFVADVALALGFGGSDAIPSAPSAPNLVAKATVAPKLDRVEHASATFDAALEPSFIAAVAQQTVTKPVSLRVDVRDVRTAIPAKGADGLALDASVAIKGENGLFVKELSRDVAFADIVAAVQSVDAAKGATVSLSGRVDKGAIDLRQTLGPLPKDFANVDPLAIDTRGTVKITGLDGPALVAWLPEQRDTIEAAAIRGLGIDLRNEPLPGKPGQRVTLQLSGDPVHGEVIAGIEKASARVEKLDIGGVIGKTLAKSLQHESKESRVRLAEDVPFSLALEAPVTLVYDDLKSGKLPNGLSAKLAIPQAIVSKAPQVAAPFAIRDFTASVAVEPSGKALTTKGAFVLVGTTSPTDRVEQGTFDLAWAKKDGPSLLKGLSGETKLSGISVPWIETLLGRPKGQISTWTGDTGSLQVSMGATAQGESIKVSPAFPRLSGSIDVLAQGESVQASTNGLGVRVDRKALTELTAQPTPGDTGSRYDFQGDLVAQVSSLSVRMPKALAANGNALAGTSLDLAMETQGVGINVQTPGKAPGRLDMPAISLKANAKDIGQGITFSASDRGTAPGASGPSPSLAISGAIRNALDAAGAATPEKAVVDLDASVKALPTVFVDLIGATGGTVNRSLGETLDLTAKAQSLSKRSGQLSVEMTAPYAEFKAPSVKVIDGVATVVKEAPVTATFALSPGMRDDILYAINPVFADVEVASERAKFNMPELAYPLDGDMTKCNGDCKLEIGDIKFKSQQVTSIVLLVLAENPAGVEGRIRPLAINVKNGVLSYKEFGVKLGRMQTATGQGWRTQFDMEGTVDLTKHPIYVNGITTSLPIAQLSKNIPGANDFLTAIGGAGSDVGKSLTVGIEWSGPLYDKDGKRAKLNQRVTFPKVEDLLKNPSAIEKIGGQIIDAIQKDKNKKK
ncbi:MAG: hypothetical protein U0572_03515 [Phycisphaerales bacterium]